MGLKVGLTPWTVAESGECVLAGSIFSIMFLNLSSWLLRWSILLSIVYTSSDVELDMVRTHRYPGLVLRTDFVEESHPTLFQKVSHHCQNLCRP